MIRIKKIKLKTVLLYMGIGALVSFTMLPLIYLFNTAFKPMDEMFLFPPQFFVRRPTLRNFTDLSLSLSTFEVPFTRYLFNSVLMTVGTIVGTLIVGTCAAYALSNKFKLPGSGVIFSIVIAALMFSPHVTQIPAYMIVNDLGLLNTYWALILPKLAMPMGVFLMKQFIDQIPGTMLEAARIDGANEVKIFSTIVIPMTTPAWTTLVVFTFVATWNDFFTPLIMTTSEDMKTLILAIQTIGVSLARAGANNAAALLMILPPIAVFLTMQKKVMNTMMYSGIKG